MLMLDHGVINVWGMIFLWNFMFYCRNMMCRLFCLDPHCIVIDFMDILLNYLIIYLILIFLIQILLLIIRFIIQYIL